MSAHWSFDPADTLQVADTGVDLTGNTDAWPILNLLQLTRTQNTFYFTRGRYLIRLFPGRSAVRFFARLTFVFEKGAVLVPRAFDAEGTPVAASYVPCSNCCRIELSAPASALETGVRAGLEPTELARRPSEYRVIISGKVQAPMSQIFEVDSYRAACTQRTALAVPNMATGLPIPGGDGTPMAVATAISSRRIKAVAAVQGPGNAELYPQWYGAGVAASTVEYGELVEQSGVVVYNQTSDGRAVDACLLASIPGQTVRFAGRFDLVSNYLLPGRSYVGHTATVSRPPESHVRLSDRAGFNEIASALNALRAAYYRHQNATVTDTLLGLRGAAVHGPGTPLPQSTLLPGFAFLTPPFSTDIQKGRIRDLANHLLLVLTTHMTERGRHFPPELTPLQAKQIRFSQEARGVALVELRGLAHFLLNLYQEHVLSESHATPDTVNHVGFVPQEADRTFTTEWMVADPPDPAYDAIRALPGMTNAPWSREPAPLSIRGFTFETPIESQGPYEGFQLEEAAFIYVGASSKGDGRSTVVVSDCVFRDSPGDGVEVSFNANATLTRVRFRDCFRGGLTVVGGNSVVAVEEMISESGTRKTGIDAEVLTYTWDGTRPRRLPRPGETTVSDSYFRIDLDTVYLDGNLQVGRFGPGFDGLSDTSSLVGTNVLVDGGPLLLEPDAMTFDFSASKLTTSEIGGAYKPQASSSALNSIRYGRTPIGSAVTFNDCLIAVRPQGLVTPMGNSTIVPLHEYAALPVTPTAATALEVSATDCVFIVEDLERIVATADADLRPSGRLPRANRAMLGATEPIDGMYTAAALPPPKFIIAGLWLVDSQTPTVGQRRVSLRRGWIGAGYTVGVMSERRGVFEVSGTVVDSDVGFLWRTGRLLTTCNLDASLERVAFSGSHFALMELLSGVRGTPTPTQCRIAHREIVVPVDSAFWAYWLDESVPNTAVAGHFNFTGQRLIIGSADKEPCSAPTGSTRTAGRLLGFPGDNFALTDPRLGKYYFWTKFLNSDQTTFTSVSRGRWNRIRSVVPFRRV